VKIAADQPSALLTFLDRVLRAHLRKHARELALLVDDECGADDAEYFLP